MEASLTVAPQTPHTGHYQRKQRRQEQLQIVADEKIFLPGFAYDGRRIDSIATMRDRLALKDRIIMLQGIVAIMITERPFRPAFMRLRAADQREFGFRNQPVFDQGV